MLGGVVWVGLVRYPMPVNCHEGSSLGSSVATNVGVKYCYKHTLTVLNQCVTVNFADRAGGSHSKAKGSEDQPQQQQQQPAAASPRAKTQSQPQKKKPKKKKGGKW